MWNCGGAEEVEGGVSIRSTSANEGVAGAVGGGGVRVLMDSRGRRTRHQWQPVKAEAKTEAAL